MRARKDMRSPSNPASCRAVVNARYRASKGRMQPMNTEPGLASCASSLLRGTPQVRPSQAATAWAGAMPGYAEAWIFRSPHCGMAPALLRESVAGPGHRGHIASAAATQIAPALASVALAQATALLPRSGRPKPAKARPSRTGLWAGAAARSIRPEARTAAPTTPP
jgi:hypothetical protein